MGEAGPHLRSRNRGQQGAARSAMQVQAQIGPESADGGGLRVQERIDIRVALENRTERGLDTTASRRSGRARLSRCSAGVVRTQSPSDRSRMTRTRPPTRHSIQRGCHPLMTLLLDFGFVDQHHRDVVFNRVNAMALNAFKAAAVGLQLDGRLAERADEYFQKIFAQSHIDVTVYSLASSYAAAALISARALAITPRY